MVTTFYPPYSFGGDAIYIHRLTNELARVGHKVDVIHDADSYYALQSRDPVEDFPNHSNVTLHTLKSRAGILSPLLTQQTGMPFFKRKTIQRLLESSAYDVIHYHNMSLIGITALKYGKAIKLYTMHEHWLVCPMHVLWKYNREVCTKKNCISCQIIGKRPPQLWRYTSLLDRTLKHIDAFISPSRFTLRKHQELGLRIPITHIPYFLPNKGHDENNKDRFSSHHSRPFFLFVGRLEKIKGLQNVIPVVKRLPEYDLLIAGGGQYEAALRALAGDAPNIRFTGKLDHARLQELYRHATAVVVPSVCYEVFGIIIIESFAMKTPVLVNNLGALPEVVEDSGGGLVYNSEAGLIQTMKMLAENRELRDELGRKGYEAYLKYWDEKSHLQMYFGLIEKIRQKRGNLTGGV